MTPTITNEMLIDAWIRFRDCPSRYSLLVEVARTHGRSCFYANRGLGPCSEELDLDRLLPESRGGRYTLKNCVIACSRHNRMRGDMNVEEFLSSGR